MQAQVKEYWVTYALVGICIVLFCIQVLMGVSPMQPASQDLLDWGANFLFFSYTSEPWRMFTSMFLHVGFIHIAFNTYALYMFGQVSEKLFGKWFYLALFIVSGIGGNLLNNSLALYDYVNATAVSGYQLPAISAGASGGIMGLGGALLVCALFNVSDNQISLNKKPLLWLMGINLVMGFTIPNIDNAAHIGGMLTAGFMALVFCVFFNKKQKNIGKVVATVLPVLAFVMLYFLTWRNHQPDLLEAVKVIQQKQIFSK